MKQKETCLKYELESLGVCPKRKEIPFKIAFLVFGWDFNLNNVTVLLDQATWATCLRPRCLDLLPVESGNAPGVSALPSILAPPQTLHRSLLAQTGP